LLSEPSNHYNNSMRQAGIRTPAFPRPPEAEGGFPMGVVICLPLFGPPGREMEEGTVLQGKQLRGLATQLQERLQKTADTLDRLAAAGWTARVAMYDAILSQRGVETREEAVRRLQALGINVEELVIFEEMEEEELGEG
jgi:hypothetical protein